MSKTKISDNPLAGITERRTGKSKALRKPKKASPTSPKSFRFSLDDMDRLKDLTEIVSADAGKMRISETIVMRALIRLAGELEPKEIIEKIKIIKMEA